MAYQTNAQGVGTTAQVVVGLFQNAEDAHQAVTQLRADGFTSQQIGAAFRNNTGGRHGERSLANSSTTAANQESWWQKVKDAFSPDDRAEHADQLRTATSADRVDVNADEYARGEYEYDFAGDDFAGSLAAAGIPADRAAYLTRSLESGGAIVTVRDADRGQQAEQIISANNGRVRYEDAADTSVTGVPAAGYAGRSSVDAVADDYAAGVDRDVSDRAYAERPSKDVDAPAGDRIQLFGEVLRVHKERINRGEVRIRKDVITENQTIEVPVTREELLLERVPVAGNTPAPSANIGRDQEIRVPLSEETVRLEKQPVLREEVVVGKREISDVATLSDDVRHEELRVDSDGVETPRRQVAGEELAQDVRKRG